LIFLVCLLFPTLISAPSFSESFAVPRILSFNLPEPEKENADALDCNLDSLEKCFRRFQHILALFDFGHRQLAVRRQPSSPQDGAQALREAETLSNWTEIASRDGAMTIWDFATAMHLVRKNLDACPTVNAMVDRSQLERAIALFHQSFPNAKHIRHAAAHPAEIHGTPARTALNSHEGSYDDGFIRIDNSYGTVITGTFNRQVLATIYGQIIGYELSQASVDKLAAVLTAVNAALTPASETLHAQHMQRLR
jgi:hypothetical protein